MKTNDLIKAALKADAGAAPAFDEGLHERVLEAAFIDRTAVHRRPSSSVLSNERGRFWLLLGPAALAACVIFGRFYRSPAPPTDDWSASVAAVASAARPQMAIAGLPMRPFEQNLTTLHDDARELGRFVVNQLDVLPF